MQGKYLREMVKNFKMNGINNDAINKEIEYRYSGCGQKNQLFVRYSLEDLLTALHYIKLNEVNMDKNIRSTNPNLDMNNPLVKSIIESMIRRGMDAKTKLNVGDKVLIDNCDGTYTDALYKSEASDTLVFAKPKESSCKGGYESTISCQKN
mgnify:CR=1 FL=1